MDMNNVMINAWVAWIYESDSNQIGRCDGAGRDNRQGAIQCYKMKMKICLFFGTGGSFNP